ncbi:MAG: hypothetical protein HKN14_13125 [Marinicaulis sp.]|nr:hypothetical protein [Marinicaulis sp.]NNE41847.1 hypothetical protein [Marinicaulis sp.]NNL90299.1 hypothetical protein [Marinicaulis sp.]
MNVHQLKVLFIDLIETMKLEKAYITAGAFEKLEKIADRKQLRIAALEKLLNNPQLRHEIGQCSKEIERFERNARENESLLLSAKNGVSAAKHRLKQIAMRARNIGVYGENGNKIQTHNSVVTRNKIA